MQPEIPANSCNLNVYKFSVKSGVRREKTL